MRLHQILVALEEQIPNLTVSATKLGTGHNFTVKDFRAAVDAARTIRSTGILGAASAKVLSFTEIINHVDDAVTVAKDDWAGFSSAISNLRSRAQLAAEILGEFLPEEPNDAVAFKLPSGLDLTDTSRILIEIKKFMEQVTLNEHLDGEMKLVGFEHGSSWIVLTVGTAAVAFLGALVDLYFRLQERKLALDEKREHIRTMRINNDSLEAIEEALEEELLTFRDSEIQRILEEAGMPSVPGEMKERVRHSIDLLATLLRKGVEVQPSVNAPAKTKKLFPAKKVLKGPVPQIEGDKKG